MDASSEQTATMEISYGEDASDKFDLYPAPAAADRAPLLVFVHGGAWRSCVFLPFSPQRPLTANSEDKANHAALARSLARLTNCPVVVPNYRLTTQQNPVRHPAHASDVLRFLHFLSSWSGPGVPDCSRLLLLGHSCAAHILASILLTSPFPGLAPSPQLLTATRAVILSEGIYDIDLLLRSFPSYRQWFIADAFGDRDAYPDVNVASYALRSGGEHIRWLILHSTGDILVDQLQSDAMYAHLSAISRGDASAQPPTVSKNFGELKEGHNELLKGSVYPQIVADFVAGLGRGGGEAPPNA